MQSALSGLSSQEALRRLAEYGRNEVENEHLSLVQALLIE
jgi:hypothetical protein